MKALLITVFNIANHHYLHVFIYFILFVCVFRVKSKRRFVQPNNGFMVQLRLFHKMGWKIDPTHEKFKLYRLRMAADKVRKGTVPLIDFAIFMIFSLMSLNYAEVIGESYTIKEWWFCFRNYSFVSCCFILINFLVIVN